MNTTPTTRDPRTAPPDRGPSVPAGATPAVGKPLPADTVLYLLDTCPEGIKATFTRGLHAAYETGCLSNGEDRYWTGYLDGARDQGASDYRRGHADGYAEAVDDLARLQREAVRSARASISGPDFAALADLRGDHARADAQRAILRDRGIA